jgi:hypothetical protein
MFENMTCYVMSSVFREVVDPCGAISLLTMWDCFVAKNASRNDSPLSIDFAIAVIYAEAAPG